MNSDALVMVVVIPSFLLTCGFIVWVLVDGRRRGLTAKGKAEFYHRMMEKFGSAREFIEFVQTEGGSRFLDSLSVERIGPTDRILGSLQKGAILGIVGLGCLFLGWKHHELFSIIGTLALCLGVGFLLSSAISYRLSKKWGLLSSIGSGRIGELEQK
jgi:hypothetical protein